MPDDPTTSQLRPQSIVWAGRVFSSQAEFARWLETRNESYALWVKRHPSAAWFHKARPVVAAKPAKPTSVKAAEVDRDFARIFVAAAFALGALLLAGAVIRSGPAGIVSALRVRRRLPPLAPARAIGRGPHAPVPASTRSGPHRVHPASVSHRRTGGTVVPLYVPPEPDSQPAVARPAAALEAPALELRKPVVVVEQAFAAAEPERVIEPELVIEPDLTVVHFPVAAPQLVPEPEPDAEPEPEAVAEPEPEPQPEPEPVVPAEPEPAEDLVVATTPVPPPAVEEPAPVAEPEPIVEDAPILVPPPSFEVPALEPLDQPVAPAARAEPPPGDAEEVEAGPLLCEIGLWQGYLKSQFYAGVVDPDGTEYSVAHSVPFRSRNPRSDDQAAKAAHTELAEQLLELGWRRDGSGDEWWATRFELEEDAPVG